MSTLTKKGVQFKSANEKNRSQTSTLDMDRVKIVPLPRRNDDIYMRGVRRRRA